MTTAKRILRTPLALGIGATAVLALQPHQAQAASTITLLQRDVRDHFVDVGPKGGPENPPSMGDSYYSLNALLDPATKTKVGRGHGACHTTVPGRKAVALCTFVLRTTHGSIVATGAFPFTASTVTLPVTGGSGSYSDSSGTATWHQGSGDFASWTIRLNG